MAGPSENPGRIPPSHNPPTRIDVSSQATGAPVSRSTRDHGPQALSGTKDTPRSWRAKTLTPRASFRKRSWETIKYSRGVETATGLQRGCRKRRVCLAKAAPDLQLRPRRVCFDIIDRAGSTLRTDRAGSAVASYRCNACSNSFIKTTTTHVFKSCRRYPHGLAVCHSDRLAQPKRPSRGGTGRLTGAGREP